MPRWVLRIRATLDEFGVVWARWTFAGVMHVCNIADALDAGVHVDGQGYGGVIVV